VTDFSGQTVVVSGAGVGLGRGIALAFALAGAAVWGCDITGDGLEGTAALAVDLPARITHRVVDVRDREAVHRFAREALASTGRIDVLVNDAGGLSGQTGKPVEDVTDAEWREIIDVNATSAFYATQAVVPGMKRAKFGRIVNISSSAGLTRTVTGIQAYATSKAGMIGLTRQLAHELGPFGITVNSVAPGSVPCNPYSAGKWEALGEAGRHAALQNIAMRRAGTPADVAAAVLFFASAAAGWITGQTLAVDGGK
jgi:3-oxoacyl-[acyl-carrier protein] reductase